MFTVWFSLCLAAHAGEAPLDVAALPAPVKAAISAKYPGATIAAASHETEDGVESYEAALVFGDRKLSVEYTADGKQAEEEEVVALTSTPEVVQKALTAKYNGWTVGKVERSSTANATVYEVVVKKGSSAKEVVFGADGVVVREEKADED